MTWSELLPGEDDAREVQYQNTTSCDGILDVFCQSAIVNMIRSFNASEAAEGGSRCRQLVQHVTMKLQNDSSTCGSEGSWIANFINVTGGALPGPDTSSARNYRLGNGECRPVLPQQYQLYKVAVMRPFYFADPPESDSDFYGRVFGGRAGFTPVITVVYEGGTNSTRPDVQFSCMQTFERDGHSREDVFNSGATAGWRVGSLLLTVLLPIGLAYAF